MGAAPNGLANGSAKADRYNEDEPASRKAVVASVSFYLVAALVMVMVNKWVLNSVPIPLSFLLVQLLTAVVLMHIASMFRMWKIPDMRMSTCRGLVPLVSINCVGLAANTYCLQYVDASFYQIARGLVLPFTTGLTFLMLSAVPSRPCLAAIGVVCFGYFIGVANENMSVSLLGILLGVLSSATTAGHAVVVKRSLPIVNGSSMDLAYFANLLSAIVLAPAAVLAETGAVLDMIAVGGEGLRTFILGSVVTGVFGFAICVAGFISIKVTSPVTHMISAAVRGIIQTILGVVLFSDIVTGGRMSSIMVVLVGSLMYTWYKEKEMRQAEARRNLGNGVLPMHSSAVRADAENDPEADALIAADEMIREADEREREASIRAPAARGSLQP